MSQPQEEREMESTISSCSQKVPKSLFCDVTGCTHTFPSDKDYDTRSISKAHHHGTPYGQNWQKYSPKQNKCVSIGKQVKNQRDLEQLRPKK